MRNYERTAALVKRVDVTISSAQLLALNATPRSLVAAPGSGLYLVFDGAIIHKPAGTAYGGIAGGEDLSIKYTDASGLEVGVCEATGFLDQATAQVRYVYPSLATATGGAGINTAITPVANAALVLHLLTGEIITGTSPLYVRAYYKVITLPSA